MKSRLERKLTQIRSNSNGREFIPADAKVDDMCWGVPSPADYLHSQTIARPLS